jgi:hypothetical protein
VELYLPKGSKVDLKKQKVILINKEKKSHLILCKEICMVYIEADEKLKSILLCNITKHVIQT